MMWFQVVHYLLAHLSALLRCRKKVLGVADCWSKHVQTLSGWKHTSDTFNICCYANKCWL